MKGLRPWSLAYFLMSASLVCGKSLEAPGFSLWSSAHSEMSKESSIAPEDMHAIVSEDDSGDPGFCVQRVDVLVCVLDLWWRS